MNVKPVRCIHCLNPAGTPEADHVFPASWYPSSTPDTVQRWTAPSCPKCNRELGQLEKDLLIRLVLSTAPGSEAAAGLAARVFRSLGLDVDGLPEKEKAIRDGLRAKIRSEFIPPGEAAELPGKIPGLGPPDGRSMGALPIPWAGLSIIAEKIARGCEYKYKNRQRLIMPPYGIRTLVRESDFIPEPFAAACKILDFGPGCKIRRLFFTEDPDTVWYFISIWNTLNMHVRIELEAELLKAEQQFRKCKGIVPPENRRMEISPYLRNIKPEAPGTG
ncbi:MAG: hypothetical protein ABSH49_02565 [Bryobacteraceae bacterium]